MEKIIDGNNENLLSYFYKNHKRWPFTFQLNEFISGVNKLDNLTDNKIYIVERTVFSDKECFSTNCYNTGLMNKIKWDIYNMCLIGYYKNPMRTR